MFEVTTMTEFLMLRRRHVVAGRVAFCYLSGVVREPVWGCLRKFVPKTDPRHIKSETDGVTH